MGPTQAPPAETPALVTPGCWEGVAGKVFLVLFLIYLVVVSAGERDRVIQPLS